MNKLSLISFIVWFHAFFAMGQNDFLVKGKTYYVDSSNGNDANCGTSKTSPWKTASRINQMDLVPGDSILFKSGSQFTGQLIIRAKGNNSKPVVISSYGEGKSPVIEGVGKTKETVLVYNSEFVEISNMEITNKGEKPEAFRGGITILATNAGILNHIYLKNLVVHDINGGIRKEDRGVGINVVVRDTLVPTCFNDLRIENCKIYNVDRDGIKTATPFASRYKWFPNTALVIRGNEIENVGGDGIIVMGCDGALVEKNVVKYSRQRAPDHAAGIWPWGSDDTLIQFNEVSFTKGTMDGQGFDSDNNCRNTIIQYNYSHDNDGGFLLLCADGTRSPRISAGNIGTVVRYNISQNDHCRLFKTAGSVQSAKVYNNVFYNSDTAVQVFITTEWNGWAEDIAVYNNIFYLKGNGHFGHMIEKHPDGTFSIAPGFAPAINIFFGNNVYFGNFSQLPADNSAITIDPMLRGPGTAPDGFNGLDGYQLKPGSPCAKSGAYIPNHGEKDFWGNRISVKGPVSVGAYQFEK